MSSQFQNRIYNYEAPPPPAAWDVIREALDESHLSDKFPAVIHNVSATPPPHNWTMIAAALDGYSSKEQYPATLLEMEAIPPVSVWENIKTVLDSEGDAVIPARRKLSPFLKYAAAAAVITAVAFGAVKIINNKKPNEDIAASKTDVPVTNNTVLSEDSNPIDSGNDNNEAQIQVQRDDAALEESKHLYASLDISDNRRIKSRIAKEFFLTPVDAISSAENHNPENTYRDLECTEISGTIDMTSNPAIDMASRYVMFMTPDGNIIRLSKKLGNIVCCVSGQEQDEDCKDQLNKWRQKIANSPVAPSPGNFMDILDLLQTLKDNNL